MRGQDFYERPGWSGFWGQGGAASKGALVRMLAVAFALPAMVAACKPKAPDDGWTDAALTCDNVSCSGHGTCVMGDGGPVCECEDGYAPVGLDCVAAVCSPNPCTDPPSPTCEDEGHLRTWPENGTCSEVDGTVTCDYGSGELEECRQGEVCRNGACMPNNTSPPAPGDLVITELMINPSSIQDQDGEWFEVANVSDRVIDLLGLVVEDADANSFAVTADTHVTVGPGEFFVFGPNADAATNGGVAVDYEYTGLMLNNDGDSLTLSYDGRTIDTVVYDDGTLYPILAGASMSLDPEALNASDNDDPANWCAATSSYDSRNKGTPGAVNDTCGEPNPCEPNPCTAPPDAYCQGDLAVGPTLNPGTCTLDATGNPQCDYLVKNVDCTETGEVCVGGVCAADPCNPNPCTTPPAAYCQNDVAVYPTLDPGSCTVDATGNPQCDYGVTNEDCAAQSETCQDGACQGTQTRRPVAGELVITEFMANPDAVGDSDGEWFEIFNATTDNLDIQGMVIRDNDSDSHTLPRTSPIVIGPGAYFVLGRNGDTNANGHVTVDYVYGSSFTLGNSGDEIVIEIDGVIIDEVDYGNGTGPAVSAGHSTSLDPNFLDATSNDQGSHWCPATSQITPGGDYGTPGAPNDGCQ